MKPILVPLALVSVLAGCRGETHPEPAPAPVVSAPASSAPASSALGTTALPAAAPVSARPVAAIDPARLVGSWRVDPADIATDPDVLRLPPAAQKEAVEAATRLLDQVRLDFGADGSLQLVDGPRTRTGRYTLEKKSNGSTQIRVSLAREEEAPREEVLEVALEGAALRVTAAEGKSRRFIQR